MRMTRALKTPLVILLALSVFVLAGCAFTGGSSTPKSTSSAVLSTPNSTPSTASSTPSSAATQQVRISNACTLPPPSSSPDSAPQVGDIPDSQVFVTYNSVPGSYQLQVPEGWARTTNAADVSFIQKLDGLQVSLSYASAQPTADSVSKNQAVALEQSGKAVRDVCVQNMKIHSATVVLMVYTSESAPDPVTGKQVRLENNAYLFFNNGKLAILTLWAPLGSDNVDQWNLISRSFKWV